MTTRRAQRGFTLIEMMVALVLFAAITVGMMSVAITMTNGYRDQEVTIATESSTRSTLEFISQGLRGASPGVSSATQVSQTHVCTTGLLNSFRIENNLTVAGLASTPDALTVVMPAGSVVTTTKNTYTAGANTVEVRNANDLKIGDQVLITDYSTGHILRITGKSAATIAPTAAPAATLSFATLGACATDGLVTADNIPATGYPTGSMIVRVMRARFSVGFLAGDTVPMLFMDADGEDTSVAAQPIAEGIEDMQIAVGVDLNNDGFLAAESTTANNDEWLGNVTGETLYDSTLPAHATVRAIRITLVARTAKEALGNNAYRLPAVEDRAQNVATDNFRRRLLTSVIEIRNLGGSP